MRNSLTYLTRRCPRACGYCALRDATDVGKELTTEQWNKAFSILKKLGIDFNLILGNETWLLGTQLLNLMKYNQVPYALYTTCPEPLWTKYRESFFESGFIDNLSCGIDYPIDLPMDHPGRLDDSYKKSVAAYTGMVWAKENYPNVDVHGTITIHKLNFMYIRDIIKMLTNKGIFIALNLIHWNKDGNYDFFPNKEVLSDLVFNDSDVPQLQKVLDDLHTDLGFLQNPEIFKIDASVLSNMGWHCGGNPYGGPTIDSDGTLRVCGYRKGTHTPKFSIFDLPEREQEWKDAVYADAMDCPGCAWTYPMGFHYWQSKNDPAGGIASFVKHADKHIPETNWSKRKLE